MEHIAFNDLPDYRFYNKLIKNKKLDKILIHRLKKSLQYLESKQRELKKQPENDTRSIESIIKYLKKDMVHQFKLTDYDLSIKQEIKNTDTFITQVKNIIENNFSNSI